MLCAISSKCFLTATKTQSLKKKKKKRNKKQIRLVIKSGKFYEYVSSFF